MSTSQADGGTRSGLLWEVERILDELHQDNKHIDILLMENVPQVIGTGAIKDFQKWEQKLERLGYQCYIEVLNAKHYGIPQNRQRCFMVSIYGDYSYHFPYPITLKYKLKDFLEKQVDEKYYLSNKMIQYITADNEKWTANNDKALVNRSIACTINTAPGQRRCDASNYIAPTLEGGDIDLKKIGGFFDKDKSLKEIYLIDSGPDRATAEKLYIALKKEFSKFFSSNLKPSFMVTFLPSSPATPKFLLPLDEFPDAPATNKF